MATKKELEEAVDDFFSGEYEITEGTAIPDVSDIAFGKYGRELSLAMLFIDIKESTKIVDAFRRTTGARMYKSFLWGIARIAKMNDGELRSFNGDGVLVAFGGKYPCTHAAKAALQMNWFIKEILKPKMDNYFENNQSLEGLEFDCGIGIDFGKVLVVRGGIKGENNNDLVWVGNATNYAVKLSDLGSSPNRIYISETVYKNMADSSKFSSDERNMWEERVWKTMNDQKIYRSHWTWTIN